MPHRNDESLLRDARTTSVCGECGDIFGDVLGGYVQECRCTSRTTKAPRWPSYDFNVAIDLCRGCTTDVIVSGSRWHLFFCSLCADRVRAENHRRERTGYIPIGRHSLHHGISWNGGGPPPAVVADQMSLLWSRVAELERIHRHRVRSVVMSSKVSVLPTLSFLERARELYHRDEAIDELAMVFGTRRQ